MNGLVPRRTSHSPPEIPQRVFPEQLPTFRFSRCRQIAMTFRHVVARRCGDETRRDTVNERLVRNTISNGVTKKPRPQHSTTRNPPNSTDQPSHNQQQIFRHLPDCQSRGLPLVHLRQARRRLTSPWQQHHRAGYRTRRLDRGACLTFRHERTIHAGVRRHPA